MRVSIRYGGGEAERVYRYAAELVALAPDVILAGGSNTVSPPTSGNTRRAGRLRACA